MRIGLICCEYPPGPHGGIGAMNQMMARALVRAGHEVRVAGVYRPDYPAPDYEEDQGVPVWRLRESPRPLGWVAARWRLYRLVSGWIRKGELDLVEFPDYQGWTADWPRLPVPLIARLHGSETYFARELRKPVRRSSYWLERAALQRADFWCSVCQYTAKRTQQAFNIQSKATAILYNPVELTVTPRGSERSTHVVFTGTLTFKKGVESLIRAWPLVIAECPDAFLHVYGKDGRTARGGSMRAHLEWLLPDHAHRSVRFHDHVPRAELLETLAQAAAAVFPSFAETFAMAPLEAMACGCPTIYSRRGSGRELIEDSRDGLLVDPGRPQEIAAAIVRLLRDRAFARKLGEAGRQRVSTVFSMAKLLPENVAFYEACIDSFQAKDTSAKLAVDRTAPQSVL